MYFLFYKHYGRAQNDTKYRDVTVWCAELVGRGKNGRVLRETSLCFID